MLLFWRRFELFLEKAATALGPRWPPWSAATASNDGLSGGLLLTHSWAACSLVPLKMRSRPSPRQPAACASPGRGHRRFPAQWLWFVVSWEPMIICFSCARPGQEFCFSAAEPGGQYCWSKGWPASKGPLTRSWLKAWILATLSSDF